MTTTTAAAGTDSRAPATSLVLFVSAAAVALASHALSEAPAALRGTLLFGGIAGVLATTQRHWVNKSSSRVALAMVGGVLAAALVGRVPIQAYAGVTRYQPTVELLVGVSLLRKVAQRARFDAWLATRVGRVGPRLRAPLLCALSCLLAAPLSVGAVAVVCASLANVVRPKTSLAVVSMRSMGATMFVLPTTAGAAIVSASLPALDRSELLRLGAPLFFAVVLTCCLRPIELSPTPRAPDEAERSTLWPLGLFWVLVALLLFLAQMHGASAIAVAACLTFSVEATYRRRPSAHVISDVRQALSGVAAELVLLFACGILTGFLAVAPLPASLQAALHHWVATPATAAGLVLFVLPLLSLLGAHPVVLFSLAFPLLSRRVLGGGAREYLVWVTMFALAQLISPTSTSARLAASSLDVSSPRVSWRTHSLFAATLASAIWLYLVWG